MKLTLELTEKEVAALQAVRVAAADAADKMVTDKSNSKEALRRGFQIEEGCAVIDALIRLSSSLGGKS